jgi:hypothetical protein
MENIRNLITARIYLIIDDAMWKPATQLTDSNLRFDVVKKTNNSIANQINIDMYTVKLRIIEDSKNPV